MAEAEERSQEETEQRLQKLLEGAFSGPSTQLKHIPKRKSKSQAVGSLPSRKKPKDVA